ncbi:hypothetical protein N9K11_01440 [bacterium]|nr:hypothetical protein [bacterium]MDA9327378.1 hypothetical protein [Flavobacteriaceae bacterium]MDB4065045.1 hypothetical protein [Flavobacteriaceae bacterium]MDB4228398.1 hypothetical protein [Flavobacteriaceae bacterium]
MKKFLLFSFVAILFVGCDEDSENLPAPNYTIEGKWTFGDNSLNTMYLFEDGVRYTYYCVADDCSSLYNSYEANDGNHIPGTNNYTVEDNILTVDLNFGNELVTPIIFECDGGEVIFETPEYSLFRLNSDCN